MTSNRNKYSYKTINGKKKRLHRHIMEEKLKRELNPNEHIYHVDGDSRNNDIDNLIIITKKCREDFSS
jgi:hypothetical protein